MRLNEWSVRRALALFFHHQSSHTLAALALSVAALVLGTWQWHEQGLRRAQLDLANAEAAQQLVSLESQLDTLRKQQMSQLAANGLPSLDTQSSIATKIPDLLQARGLRLGDLSLGRSVADKTKGYWRQDIGLRLSGAFPTVREALLDLSDFAANVSLSTLRLSRDDQHEGIVECEAVLQARYRLEAGEDDAGKD